MERPRLYCVAVVLPEIPGMLGTAYADKGFKTGLAWNMPGTIHYLPFVVLARDFFVLEY